MCFWSKFSRRRLLSRLLALMFAAASAGGFWLYAAGRAEEPVPRPLVLLTNDDGVSAEGLRALVLSLGKTCDLLVSAPMRNSSGAAQSLKLTDVIRVRKLETPGAQALTVYAVDAPPATCVYLALEHFVGQRKIALVVSGINRGQNLGLDLGFSGTVGAAKTAAELGLPGIAVSLSLGSKDLEAAAEKAAQLVAEALERKLPAGTALSVNFPAIPSAEWKPPVVAMPGGRGFRLVHEVVSAVGQEVIYEAQMPQTTGPYPERSDTRAVADGHVSVTVVPTTAGPGIAPAELGGWRFFK